MHLNSAVQEVLRRQNVVLLMTLDNQVVHDFHIIFVKKQMLLRPMYVRLQVYDTK